MYLSQTVDRQCILCKDNVNTCQSALFTFTCYSLLIRQKWSTKGIGSQYLIKSADLDLEKGIVITRWCSVIGFHHAVSVLKQLSFNVVHRLHYKCVSPTAGTHSLCWLFMMKMRGESVRWEDKVFLDDAVDLVLNMTGFRWHNAVMKEAGNLKKK